MTTLKLFVKYMSLLKNRFYKLQKRKTPHIMLKSLGEDLICSDHTDSAEVSRMLTMPAPRLVDR